MKTVTIKIPDSMNESLRKRAAAQKEGFSETVRRALARELESGSDFASLAAPYRGMFRGPADLSVREGYAGSDSR
ncbi:MAG: ribbon-helix-helix protein, CopG family [Terrimicrobiaceae bacterium]